MDPVAEVLWPTLINDGPSRLKDGAATVTADRKDADCPPPFPRMVKG